MNYTRAAAENPAGTASLASGIAVRVNGLNTQTPPRHPLTRPNACLPGYPIRPRTSVTAASIARVGLPRGRTLTRISDDDDDGDGRR
ncbi:MAG: hypothetical protein FWG25_05095 [Promicromonosporaceae bacterium]|nr:hypothetical protein [Promicromonosporaceae bacterium]